MNFRQHVPIIKQSQRMFRLYVHTSTPYNESGVWGEPSPAQIDDLVDAIKALSPQAQAYVAGSLGLVPERVGERLEAAEDVLDALADAQLAVDKFRRYRQRFPEHHDERAAIQGEG